MTRVWSEGFEMRDLVGYSVVGTYITGTARSGSVALYVPRGQYLGKSITAISEFYIRFGLYVVAYSTNNPIYMSWNKGSTRLGCVYVSNGGYLTASVGTGFSATSTGTNRLSSSTWYLVEVHVLISDTGNIDVKLDGRTDITYSGDTKPGADTTVDAIRMANEDYGTSGTALSIFDDIGLNDTAGGVDDSWCGDGRIIVIKPNSDTATLDLTPSAAVGHYTLVDDIPADGDTTYVEGSVDDEEDIYDLEACGLGDVIITRIWTEARAKDTASSGKNVALITKASGGAEVSGGDVALAGSYTVKVLGAEELVNPVDSAAWEVADIDALQGGPRTRP